MIKPTQDTIIDSKSNILKELLFNLEKKISKSLIDMDDKINTPVKTFISNNNNPENLHSNKSNRSRHTHGNSHINNFVYNSNNINENVNGSAICFTPIADKFAKNLENNNSIEKLKLLEVSMSIDTQRFICSPTQLPTPESDFSKERVDFQPLQHYQKFTFLHAAEEKRTPVNYSNMGPFSPINKHFNNNLGDNLGNSNKKYYESINHFHPEFDLGSNQQLISNNLKENNNKSSNELLKFDYKLNIPQKIDFSKRTSIRDQVKVVTPVNMPRRNSSFHDLISSNQNNSNNLSTRPTQNNRMSAIESFQMKVKDQIPLLKTKIPKPKGRPSTSYFEKHVEKQAKHINQWDKTSKEYKPKCIKRDKSVNPSIRYGSITPNIQSQKNRNSINGGNFIESVNFEGTFDKKIYEIKSLDAERDNLKLFRNKLYALAILNLNEKNLTTNISQEIKNLMEEFRMKKYIIPMKDQETLKTLNDFILQAHNIPTIQKKDKEPKPRCSSVNQGRQKMVADPKHSAKKISTTPSKKLDNNNNNIAVKKKTVVKNNLVSKGGFSTINTNYVNIFNLPKNTKQTPNYQFKSNINLLNNQKNDVGLFEINNKQTLPLNSYDHLPIHHANSAQGQGYRYKPILLSSFIYILGVLRVLLLMMKFRM